MQHIIDGLIAWSDGSTTGRAAVGLLIDHGTWIDRAEFLDLAVTRVEGSDLAVIDWEAVDRALTDRTLIGTGTELGILALAVSLGAGRPIDLSDVLVGLDSHNAVLVAEAVLTAAGADTAAAVTDL